MNPENKKQIIALIVLGVVLAGVLWFMVFKKNPQTSAIQIDTPQTEQSAAGLQSPNTSTAGARISSVFQEADVDLDKLIQNIKEVEFDYALAHGSRNPTFPLVNDPMIFRARRAPLSDAEVTEDLIYAANRKDLTGILWDKEHPLAVMDDEIISVGHRFAEPIVVKAIEQNRVILALGGEGLEIVRELKEQ